MKFSTLKTWPVALGLGLTLAAGMAQAVALNPPPNVAPFYADTALSGTTAAARPELGGPVLEDVIQPFSFGGVSGTVQNRVVRSDSLGTLDFYWRIKVDSTPGTAAPVGEIVAFRLGDFGFAHLTDADWRIDGLPLENKASPYTARLFDEVSYAGGFINFIFEDPPVNATFESPFFFLHTTATAYAKTATYDLLCDLSSCQSEVFAAFAPAIPEPSTYAMLALGLALTGFAAKRPKSR